MKNLVSTVTNAPGARGIGLTLLVGACLFIQMNPSVHFQTYFWKRDNFRSTEYFKVVDEAKRLKGTVVSPEDNTIALRATGEPGLNAAFEQDCSFWKNPVGEKIKSELLRSDYLVSVKEKGFLSESYLRELGYTLSQDFNGYAIWHRAR